MASTKKITLQSSDGETFEVEEAVAVQFQTFEHMIQDDCADYVIPLPKVTSKTLVKVIEYCNKHVDSPNSEGDLKAWDTEFVKVDRLTLFDIILAADSLKIKGLLDLTTQTVADMIMGMTPEEIVEFFNTRDERRLQQGEPVGRL